MRQKQVVCRPDLKLRGPVKIYAGYTRCDHCGIYDSDPSWCDLCGRPKDGRKMGKPEPLMVGRIP